MQIDYEVLGNGLFALAAAGLAIAYQYWQYRRDLKKNRSDQLADKKKDIIERLIAYRFVLTESGSHAEEALVSFNSALSAIPVHFSDCKACIDKYRTIGTNFTPNTFYELVTTLMRSVPLGADAIDVHLLESVPTVKPR